MANVAVDQLLENQCNFILNDGKKQAWSSETNQEQFQEQNKRLYIEGRIQTLISPWANRIWRPFIVYICTHPHVYKKKKNF